MLKQFARLPILNLFHSRPEVVYNIVASGASNRKNKLSDLNENARGNMTQNLSYLISHLIRSWNNICAVPNVDFKSKKLVQGKL